MPSKGQKVTENAKQKFKESRLISWQEKFKWDEVEPAFFDMEIDISSRNSKKRKITISEFKNMVCSGMNADQIIETGVSKHLVAFLSSFCSGNIRLTKEAFEDMYSSGKSLDEISTELMIPRQHITYLRELFGIKTKGAKFIKRKQTEIPITQRQREIMCGALLGDASKMSPSSLKFVHGNEQREYIYWKSEEMKSIMSPSGVKGTTYTDKISGKERISWQFFTSANTDVEKIISEFYPNGEKLVPIKMLDNIGTLGLAIWYQDDGMVDFGRDLEKEFIITPVYKLCTDSFSKDECEMITRWMKQKFGLGAGLVPSSNGKGWRIKIDNESSDAFRKLIEPHVLPSMRYKLDYKDYLFDKGKPANSPSIFWTEVMKCPLGPSFISLPINEQEDWVRKVLSYVRANGFEHLLPRPSENEKDAKSIFLAESQKLIHEDCIGFSSTGSTYMLSFFNNFWDAKAKGMLSPRQVYENDKYLSEIIREAIIEGRFPRRHTLIRKLRRYRSNKSISLFMPCMAKAIYDNFSYEGSKVIDFCAGYGGRLLGAMSSKKVISYVGIEPNLKSYLSLNSLRENFSKVNGIQKEVLIMNQDSKVLQSFPDGSFDLCFTSPPYFNAEEYSEDVSQSCLQYEHYDEWIEKFLFFSVNESVRVAKKVIINIANTGPYKIADDLRKWALEKGILIEESFLRYPSRTKKYRLEPLFVLGRSR